MPRKSSLEKNGTSVVPKTSVVPQRRPVVGRRAQTQREAAAELAPILWHFSAKQLAQITGATKDATKKWRMGEACPNTPNVIRLGQEIDEVRNWILDGLNGGAFVPSTPVQVQQIANMVAAILQQQAQTGTGQTAAVARAKLSRKPT